MFLGPPVILHSIISPPFKIAIILWRRKGTKKYNYQYHNIFMQTYGAAILCTVLTHARAWRQKTHFFHEQQHYCKRWLQTPSSAAEALEGGNRTFQDWIRSWDGFCNSGVSWENQDGWGVWAVCLWTTEMESYCLPELPLDLSETALENRMLD